MGINANFIHLWQATVPVLRDEEGDRSSRPSVSARASHAMDVGFNIIREVVDEHQTHLVKTAKARRNYRIESFVFLTAALPKPLNRYLKMQTSDPKISFDTSLLFEFAGTALRVTPSISSNPS